MRDTATDLQGSKSGTDRLWCGVDHIQGLLESVTAPSFGGIAAASPSLAFAGSRLTTVQKVTGLDEPTSRT
jgi:hypothetical protein